MTADHDAITVLASTASKVAVVTIGDGTQVTLDTTLQIRDIGVHDPTTAELGRVLTGGPWGVRPGSRYVVFLSFWRGGTCVSAVFGYDAGTQQATLIASQAGQSRTELLVHKRRLKIPLKISLREIKRRMNPPGGLLYVDDTAEWHCPGP